jgi:hypothetical protein
MNPKLIRNQDFHISLKIGLMEEVDSSFLLRPKLIPRLFARGITSHRNIIDAIKSKADSSVFYLRSKEQTP